LRQVEKVYRVFAVTSMEASDGKKDRDFSSWSGLSDPELLF
jgi:hypothetical protein